MVTEQPQYSVVVCIFSTSQNTEISLIPNGLRLIYTCSLLLALPCIFHAGRHTWASLARNKAGVPKADIDFCLGHVNNDYKMADIYIDIDYSICDKANRAVLDLLQKKEEKKD